jgi:hypothetical protein
LENPKFFAFFFGKKKGLQKFRAKSYLSRLKEYDFVFAALNNGIP